MKLSEVVRVLIKVGDARRVYWERIVQLTGSRALAEYLTDAIDEVQKRHIDLDGLRLTSTMAVSGITAPTHRAWRIHGRDDRHRSGCPVPETAHQGSGLP
jgi:hypothetical protein